MFLRKDESQILQMAPKGNQERLKRCQRVPNANVSSFDDLCAISFYHQIDAEQLV